MDLVPQLSSPRSMSTQNSTNLTLQEAQNILKPFNCVAGKTIQSAEERALVRQALLLLTNHSDYQILGICADTPAEGLQALKTYSEALGYQPNLNPPSAEDPVYIKFNPKSGLCYAEPYTGTHRGVLVSCQSAYADGINDMYGHLPLDLFS